MNHPIRDAADQLRNDLVAWRRHLHAHPELSGQEEQTAAFIVDKLRQMGYTPRERIGGTYGVMADLAVDGTPTIALRADMDALPVDEANDVPYRSQTPGVMHACGHDAHVAMLLGAAKILADRRHELPRSVRLVFQPSEELSPGGARPMIDAGVLEGVSQVFGLHVWAEMLPGTLGTRSGPFMASPDDLKIVIRGKGGHAAMPQQCADPVVAAGELILALQTVISRSIALADHAVVSITQVHGGTANNIIPESVELGGTIRTFDEAVRSTIHQRIRELADRISAGHRATAEVIIGRGYPPVVNDRGVVEQARTVAQQLDVPPEQILNLPPQGGGEDFAYFTQVRPSAFVFVGARQEHANGHFPHHHPRFDIDERVLPLGAALLAGMVLLDAPPT